MSVFPIKKNIVYFSRIICLILFICLGRFWRWIIRLQCGKGQRHHWLHTDIVIFFNHAGTPFIWNLYMALCMSLLTGNNRNYPLTMYMYWFNWSLWCHWLTMSRYTDEITLPVINCKCAVFEVWINHKTITFSRLFVSPLEPFYWPKRRISLRGDPPCTQGHYTECLPPRIILDWKRPYLWKISGNSRVGSWKSINETVLWNI